MATAGADFGNHGQNDVLGRDARAKFALDRDRHGLKGRQGQRLRGQDVLDFAGADTKRHCTKSTMGRRVGVSTHDSDSRHRQSKLWPYHVHNALFDIAQRMQTNTKFFRVGPQSFNLYPTSRLSDGLIDVDRGCVVILGGDCQIRPTDAATSDAEPIKRLGAGHFVHQVKIDINQIGFTILTLRDKVICPDFFRQSTRRGCAHLGLLHDYFIHARLRVYLRLKPMS